MGEGNEHPGYHSSIPLPISLPGPRVHSLSRILSRPLCLFYWHLHTSSTDLYPGHGRGSPVPSENPRTRPASRRKAGRKTGPILYLPPTPHSSAPGAPLADTSPSRARNRHTLSPPPPSPCAHSLPSSCLLPAFPFPPSSARSCSLQPRLGLAG